MAPAAHQLMCRCTAPEATPSTVCRSCCAQPMAGMGGRTAAVIRVGRGARQPCSEQQPQTPSNGYLCDCGQRSGDSTDRAASHCPSNDQGSEDHAHQEADEEVRSRPGPEGAARGHQGLAAWAPRPEPRQGRSRPAATTCAVRISQPASRHGSAECARKGPNLYHPERMYRHMP